MKKSSAPYVITSISDLHRLLFLPPPEHPLVSLIDMKDIVPGCVTNDNGFVYNFYSICIKRDFKGKLKYGQQYYDFDNGIMTFFAPGQVIAVDKNEEVAVSGWWLIVHPDFLASYPAARNIKNYGYFSYAVNEALHLSQKEEETLTMITKSIEQEYRSTLDNYSQDVIVSQIELLLTYANRFYNRQFITRKKVNNDLLASLDELLSDYFNSDKVAVQGLPTVQYLSGSLHISPNYLSDLLRSVTGQSTQQHIHRKLIEKAKEILSTTSATVSEVAYQLGFEYPQSFSKLFKSKTNMSPLEFRHSFN